VIIYSSIDFKETGKIDIELLKADTREPNQVIAIQKDQDEQYLAIISGKILIMNEQFTNQLFIYKREKSNSGVDRFEFKERVLIKEMEIFTQVCMKFHFKKV
jgi:hypothetical protein